MCTEVGTLVFARNVACTNGSDAFSMSLLFPCSILVQENIIGSS